MWIRTILISISLFSCSSVEQIQKNSNSIRSLAQDSKQNFEKIYEAAVSIPPRLEEIKNRSHQGISEQTEIVAKTEGIIEATSGVVDTVPWWANTLEITMVAIAVIGVVVLLWYSGLGSLFRKLIGYVPEAKQQEAKLLDETLRGDTSLRETVAFLRAKDPVLDTAFRRRKNAKL
jgi:hypothetical protein